MFCANVRRFIAFRIFFNSRFYYPVFTILFLDFGLTIAQFSILNAVWAAVIVLAEVPSGALADVVGRKRLLVAASVIMAVEIGIICFAPAGGSPLVFYIFLANRILSGLAEAAASGADEAIAYDSLAERGAKKQWGRVLEILARYQSVGHIVAMSIGAAIYDPVLVTKAVGFLGINHQFSQSMTMRFPLYLTFILAILAVLTTLGMKDVKTSTSKKNGKAESGKASLGQAMGLTLKAGAWIFKTPFALTILLFGMMFDGLIRMVITLSSQYYRMIELPESIFGLIGSLVAMLGFVVPKLARNIAEKKNPSHALAVTALLTLTGLVSMNLFLPLAGMIPVMLTCCAMYFNGFFISYYLNQVTASEQRATVLSFKGLTYNISYGLLGILYALVLKTQRQTVSGTPNEDLIFMDTFFWFPLTFAVWFVLLMGVTRFIFTQSGIKK